MKLQDVPQQKGLLAGTREVTYATDPNGNYKLESSLGWEVKDIALRQAWDLIAEQVADILQEIGAGKKSALAYHMVSNQMDVALLSQYSGIARWRVKRHLKPSVFKKLDITTQLLYCKIFNISVTELPLVPDQPIPPLEKMDKPEVSEP